MSFLIPLLRTQRILASNSSCWLTASYLLLSSLPCREAPKMTRYRIINGQDPSAYSQRHINLLIKHNVIGSVVNVGIYNPWTVASETLGETARIAAQWMRTARYHRPNLSIAT